MNLKINAISSFPVYNFCLIDCLLVVVGGGGGGMTNFIPSFYPSVQICLIISYDCNFDKPLHNRVLSLKAGNPRISKIKLCFQMILSPKGLKFDTCFYLYENSDVF